MTNFILIANTTYILITDVEFPGDVSGIDAYNYVRTTGSNYELRQVKGCMTDGKSYMLQQA